MGARQNMTGGHPGFRHNDGDWGDKSPEHESDDCTTGVLQTRKTGLCTRPQKTRPASPQAAFLDAQTQLTAAGLVLLPAGVFSTE